MKKMLRKMIVAMMVVAAVMCEVCIPVQASVRMRPEWFMRDYQGIHWSCHGYDAIADPWIMSKRNRKFKDNDDFMIIIGYGQELYTGGDVKVKVVREDLNGDVYVKVIRIKGCPKTRKLFKNSDLIVFHKGEKPDNIDDPSQSKNELIIVH